MSDETVIHNIEEMQTMALQMKTGQARLPAMGSCA
jgi:hypothetical protein